MLGLCFAILVIISNLLTSNGRNYHHPRPMEKANQGRLPLPPMKGDRLLTLFGEDDNLQYGQLTFASVLQFLFSLLLSLFIYRDNERK